MAIFQWKSQEAGDLKDCVCVCVEEEKAQSGFLPFQDMIYGLSPL